MSTEALEAELIQVAAVAVAIVQDLRFGSTTRVLTKLDEQNKEYEVYATDQVLHAVELERIRQEDKWGARSNVDLVTWLAVLGEEVGEAAAEVEVDPRDWLGKQLVRRLVDAEKSARAILANPK